MGKDKLEIEFFQDHKWMVCSGNSNPPQFFSFRNDFAIAS